MNEMSKFKKEFETTQNKFKKDKKCYILICLPIDLSYQHTS